MPQLVAVSAKSRVTIWLPLFSFFFLLTFCFVGHISNISINLYFLTNSRSIVVRNMSIMEGFYKNGQLGLYFLARSYVIRLAFWPNNSGVTILSLRSVQGDSGIGRHTISEVFIQGPLAKLRPSVSRGFPDGPRQPRLSEGLLYLLRIIF